METSPATCSALVDLLDRVLDRGLIINADIVISLAGIPLIGINLRAALAGIETMLKYGAMREWDQSIRSGEPWRNTGINVVGASEKSRDGQHLRSTEAEQATWR